MILLSLSMSHALTIRLPVRTAVSHVVSHTTLICGQADYFGLSALTLRCGARHSCYVAFTTHGWCCLLYGFRIIKRIGELLADVLVNLLEVSSAPNFILATVRPKTV